MTMRFMNLVFHYLLAVTSLPQHATTA